MALDLEVRAGRSVSAGGLQNRSLRRDGSADQGQLISDRATHGPQAASVQVSCAIRSEASAGQDRAATIPVFQSDADGDGRLEQLTLLHCDTGETRAETADGLFIMIGAQPFTQWLPEAVSRDQWGYVLTGPDVADHRTMQRNPYALETRTRGVFAAGDVRHGSVKRVASAVGEGSIAIRLVHDYLG